MAPPLRPIHFEERMFNDDKFQEVEQMSAMYQPAALSGLPKRRRPSVGWRIWFRRGQTEAAAVTPRWSMRSVSRVPTSSSLPSTVAGCQRFGGGRSGGTARA